MAKIEFKCISKKYISTNNSFFRSKKNEEICAVDNFSLEMKDKEFIVLVGPSGCGKTTVLRIAAGLEDATEGDIYFDGTPINSLPPKSRNVSMVFQNYALYPHMSVFENIAFPLKMQKTPKKELIKRVNEVAELLDISELLQRKPQEISGGQRQRVAIGRSLIKKPCLFLMDEPLSNLDTALRQQMRTEIMKLHKKVDSSFIYVTHDQIEALTLADRIVVLNKGVIQQIGTPEEIYYKPANRFVAEFMSQGKISFIDQFLFHELCNDSCSFDVSKYYIGIRSECINVTDKCNSKCVGVIELIEKQGKDTLLHIKIGKSIIYSINTADNYNHYIVGNTVYCSAKYSDFMFFNKESNMLVSLEAVAQ